jgi:exonuclease III
MNLNFLTWNVKNNKSQDFFGDLHNHLINKNIDILILQECFFDNPFEKSSKFKEIKDFLSEEGKRWVRIFINIETRLNYTSQTSYLSNKLKCVEIIPENGYRFNLMGVHLYSEVGKSKEMQSFQNEDVPLYIKEFEEKQKSEKTIIVGDLNYKPFESELIRPNFLNASSNKELIKYFGKRELGGKKYDFFYNPMWNLLGDYDYLTKSSKINGTFYWYPDDVIKHHWNLIDGVLLRRSIMENLMIETLNVVTSLNGKLLVKSKITNSEESFLENGFSDHLPVSFTLKIL